MAQVIDFDKARKNIEKKRNDDETLFEFDNKQNDFELE